jgi:hypothetical protein
MHMPHCHTSPSQICPVIAHLTAARTTSPPPFSCTGPVAVCLIAAQPHHCLPCSCTRRCSPSQPHMPCHHAPRYCIGHVTPHCSYACPIVTHLAAAWAMSPPLQLHRVAAHITAAWAMLAPPSQPPLQPYRVTAHITAAWATSPPITAAHAPSSHALLLHGPCRPPCRCIASPHTLQLHGPCWCLPLSCTGCVATHLTAAHTTLLPLAVLAPGPTSYVCSCRNFPNSRKYIY